jgi:hypothetical protein
VRRAADVERLQVPVEQLVDGRIRARVAALVDLVEHPRPGLLGELRRLRSRRDDFHEGMAPAGERVLAGVDADADAPLGSSSTVPRARRRPGLLAVIART